MDENIIEKLRQQYFEAMMKLHNKQDVIDAMPKLEYNSFFSIMNGLITSIDQNIIQLNKEMRTLDETDQELIVLVQEEMQIMQYKKEICEQLLKEALAKGDATSETMVSLKRNLIFATTELGNICIERDLKNLPEEYYDSVLQSLINIENGLAEANDQKAKELTGDRKLAGLHEIKLFKVRVLYKNLSPDMAYVFLVKMKKSDFDHLDRKEIVIRNKNVQNEYERLKEEINNPLKKAALIQENLQVRERIFCLLNENKRGKSL